MRKSTVDGAEKQQQQQQQQQQQVSLSLSSLASVESLAASFSREASEAQEVLGSSGNPWSLPGLELNIHAFSTGQGDLFLMSELLRFLMRPNPYMQRKLRSVLQQMRWPDISQVSMIGAPADQIDHNAPIAAQTEAAAAFAAAAATSSIRAAPDDLFADDSDYDAASHAVLSIHVRRNVHADSPAASKGSSSSLSPVHRSFEYIFLAERLASTLGLESVFVSSDDRTVYESFEHTLGHGQGQGSSSPSAAAGGGGARSGSGVADDTGQPLGLHVMHVPDWMISEHSNPPASGSGGVGGDTLRAASARAAAQLADEEGAVQLASLYAMGVFSGHFIGTSSSHWGRMVREMQRWSVDGSCAPLRRGWLLPGPSTAGGAMRRQDFHAHELPVRTPTFLDLDGDTYFVGTYEAVQHPRMAPFNPNARQQ
jgi:hypothetical protein